MLVTSAARSVGAFREPAREASPPDLPAVKVVHVTTGLDMGGAQMVLCRLLERSGGNGTGISHGVVSLMKGGVLRDRIRAAGVEVEELDLARGSIPVSQTLRLSDAIRNQRPTIIQGWMYHGIMAATIAYCLRSQPCPLVWGVHHCPRSLREKKTTTQLVIRLAGLLSRLPAAIVYCSQEAARRHEGLGYRADKTRCIPNGFDVEAFRPRAGAKARIAAELGVRDTIPIVGVVGRFHPDKDFANVINAAALLSEGGHEFHLVLVGPGVDHSNQSLAEALHGFALQERVALLGQRHDVPELMAGFDVLCSCSASEAFPNVIGEAMASGVPCVVTDVGDSALIVGSTGIVVPPRDPGALADGLSRLIALDPESRRQLGLAARWRIIDHFGLGDVVQQYEALYRSLAWRGEEAQMKEVLA